MYEWKIGAQAKLIKATAKMKPNQQITLLSNILFFFWYYFHCKIYNVDFTFRITNFHIFSIGIRKPMQSVCPVLCLSAYCIAFSSISFRFSIQLNWYYDRVFRRFFLFPPQHWKIIIWNIYGFDFILSPTNTVIEWSIK